MSDSGITRRGFMGKVGQGLLAANVAGVLLRDASAQLRVPEPPDKKLGWAIVGLGSLSINQILPAFAKCEKSKVVALVSGHPEKANKLAECQQMIDAARKASRKLMVAYRCRYEPYNREAIRIARSGELGPTQMILAEAGFAIGDPNQWRLNKQLAGGGSLMDIGIYALNASRYLTGEEPAEVNAMIRSTASDPRFKEVEE